MMTQRLRYIIPFRVLEINDHVQRKLEQKKLEEEEIVARWFLVSK